jgi:cation diffusion facilitator CzcD-associated flavoprotein CzcO
MNEVEDHREVCDAVVIGAGFSGLLAVHQLRQAGVSVIALEKADSVGGTWYWNRYPGARSDSESPIYSYSDEFSEELFAKWEWKERYATQPEILAYLGWVAENLELNDFIRFNTEVNEAVYDEAREKWIVSTNKGHKIECSFLIPAVGILSDPYKPTYAGVDKFSGLMFHSAEWPDDPTVFEGKNVAIIGNGATAIQLVPELAKVAAQVTNFIRKPYHSIPGRNHALTETDWVAIHKNHKQIWQGARENGSGHPYSGFVGNALDFEPEQRMELYNRLWKRGGFPLAISSFSDIYTDPEANETVMDFLSAKIRSIVTDQDVASKLIPTDMFGGKRTPIEHGYYSAFNLPNVSLVDLKESPIEEFTSTGIRTSTESLDFDVVVWATGFDAFTGPLMKLNVQGRNGLTLEQAWASDIKTYLGLMVPGFPNLFTLYCGPLNPAILTNGPTLIEQQGGWILRLIMYMREHNLTAAEASRAATDEYVQIHDEIANASIIAQTASWWTGSNVEGKVQRVLSFIGGFPEYRTMCEQAEENYPGIKMS